MCTALDADCDDFVGFKPTTIEVVLVEVLPMPTCASVPETLYTTEVIDLEDKVGRSKITALEDTASEPKE